METPLSRRRLIEAGGVGAALSLAGCSFGSQTTQSSEGRPTVTVFAAVDQDELEAYQEELQSKLDADEINRQEARTRARKKQSELLSAAVEAFQQRADEEEGLTVTQTASDAGVMLVEGTPTALVDSLTIDSVHGLLGEDAYGEYAETPASTESS